MCFSLILVTLHDRVILDSFFFVSHVSFDLALFHSTKDKTYKSRKLTSCFLWNTYFANIYNMMEMFYKALRNKKKSGISLTRCAEKYWKNLTNRIREVELVIVNFYKIYILHMKIHSMCFILNMDVEVSSDNVARLGIGWVAICCHSNILLRQHSM